jgi:hypothetical protein
MQMMLKFLHQQRLQLDGGMTKLMIYSWFHNTELIRVLYCENWIINFLYYIRKNEYIFYTILPSYDYACIQFIFWTLW